MIVQPLTLERPVLPAVPPGPGIGQGRCPRYVYTKLTDDTSFEPQDQDQVILLVATNLRAQAEFNPRAFHGVVAAPAASVCRRRKSPVTGLPLPQQRGGRECGHRLLPSRDEWGAHLASTSPPLPWSPGGDMAAASFPPPGISGPGYTGHPSWVSRLGQSFLKVGTAAAVR